VRTVSGVTPATVDPAGIDPAGIDPADRLDAWAAEYLSAAEAERRLVDAAPTCLGRYGLRKTSLDDIAREAGVSRATVYRVFPGGKDRVVDVVLCHVVGRFFHDLEAELSSATSLEDLVTVGVATLLREAADNAVLASLIEHEPELVLPHFAFHQLDRVLDLADALCRPHLRRFLPDDEVRPAAELLARVVLTFAFRPAPWVDPRDPASVRRVVHTYVVPALTPTTPATPTPGRQPTANAAEERST
jgi:AcrR family transcriptional regulator